jgi:hypothetical protein
MSSSYLTPNMLLVIPVPTQAPGPDWASDLNSSLTILDSHNHAAGSGVQINPAGININADLPFNNSNNATQLRSVRFFPNVSALSTGSDLGCLYEAGVDLYYNDGVGNQIRITQSGNVAGAAGTITGLPSGTASAAYQSVSGTFQFQQATSTAANIDGASLIIRYPGSYPTPSGNCIILEAPSSIASQYSLVLPGLPAQTNVMTLTSAGIMSSITYDSVGTSMTSTGANAIANTRTRATGSSVGAGGVAISASSGTGSNSTNTLTQITNQSITLVTTGKSVEVKVQPASSSSSCYIGGQNSGSGLFSFVVLIYRDGSALARFYITGNQSGAWPPGSFSYVDTTASAASHNYQLYYFADTVGFPNSVATFFNIQMVAYEP